MSLDDVESLENLIRGWVNLIQTTRTTMQNKEFTDRQLAHYQRVIDEHIRLRDDLIRVRADGPDIIDNAKKQIKSLKSRLVRIKRKRDIERILKLQAEINALQHNTGDTDDDE